MREIRLADSKGTFLASNGEVSQQVRVRSDPGFNPENSPAPIRIFLHREQNGIRTGLSGT